MKKNTVSSQNVPYTDPILFKEGFFKNKREEALFLKKVEALTKKMTISR